MHAFLNTKPTELQENAQKSSIRQANREEVREEGPKEERIEKTFRKWGLTWGNNKHRDFDFKGNAPRRKWQYKWRRTQQCKESMKKEKRKNEKSPVRFQPAALCSRVPPVWLASKTAPQTAGWACVSSPKRAKAHRNTINPRIRQTILSRLRRNESKLAATLRREEGKLPNALLSHTQSYRCDQVKQIEPKKRSRKQLCSSALSAFPGRAANTPKGVKGRHEKWHV